jgi:hypothetical protein
MPFLFLFISLNKDTNFLMNFNVDIPPYITRMSSGLEDRTRKQQTRSPSEDILEPDTNISGFWVVSRATIAIFALKFPPCVT